MTLEEGEELGKGIVRGVKAYVARALSPITKRISDVETRTGALSMSMVRGVDPKAFTELEATLKLVADLRNRVKSLEDRPTLEYRGVWTEGVGFERGSFVTYNGSLWHANTTTTDKPGTTEAWQLAVKHGRDAR